MLRKHTKTTIVIALIGALGLLGCASSEPEDDNNNTNHQQNNNVNNTQPDGGTTGCQATCTQEGYVCVGIEGHQTCVPECDSGMTCSDSTRTCCYEGCVDLQNDPNNCGACRSYCNGNCINGTCVDQCGNMCSADQECCGGSCVNITTDVNNCGECGNVCDPTTANACSNGYCTCAGGAECTGGRECCGTGCKDVTSDPDNCGSCGAGCAQGETCDGGTCSCGGGPACSFGEGCCGSDCVDLDSDDDNCGSCGNTCQNGNTCNQGVCNCAGEVCQAGQLGQPATCCGASGCVNYDLMGIGGTTNCGSCGNDCTMLQICVAGQCTSM